MKNVLFEQEKIMLWNKWHFVQNKTEFMQNILKMHTFPWTPKYMKLILGLFYVCFHMWMQVS